MTELEESMARLEVYASMQEQYAESHPERDTAPCLRVASDIRAVLEALEFQRTEIASLKSGC